MSEWGIVTAPGTVRLERVLPGPIERVWAHLTESEKRARWFAAGAMDLRVGGALTLRFDHARLSHEKTPPERWRGAEGHVADGVITRCEPPRLLAFTWGSGDDASEVAFELTARGTDVLLVLTHRKLPSRDDVADVSGGWHAHLAVLAAVLADEPPPGFWSLVGAVDAEYRTRTPRFVLARVVRRFATPAERVFDAFLDPARAGQFLFATPAGRMVRAEVDARVGGEFVFTDRRDGQDVEHRGTWLEIDRPRRLVFAFAVSGHPEPTRVAIDVDPTDDGCVLTLTHELPAEAAPHRERATAGWSTILEQLVRVVAPAAA